LNRDAKTWQAIKVLQREKLTNDEEQTQTKKSETSSHSPNANKRLSALKKTIVDSVYIAKHSSCCSHGAQASRLPSKPDEIPSIWQNIKVF